MLIIGKKQFKVIRREKFIDGGVLHYTLAVEGDTREYQDKLLDMLMVVHNEGVKEFKGQIILPHHNEETGSTMFWLYVEER